MKEITISEFRANCFALIQRAQKTGKPFRIMRFGKPIAEVAPVPTVRRPEEWIGSMKGTAKILGDIVSPANDDDDWEVLRD